MWNNRRHLAYTDSVQISVTDKQTDKKLNVFGHPGGVCIPHFDQISVKISVLGVLYPSRYTDGGEIWHGEGD